MVRKTKGSTAPAEAAAATGSGQSSPRSVKSESSDHASDPSLQLISHQLATILSKIGQMEGRLRVTEATTAQLNASFAGTPIKSPAPSSSMSMMAPPSRSMLPKLEKLTMKKGIGALLWLEQFMRHAKGNKIPEEDWVDNALNYLDDDVLAAASFADCGNRWDKFAVAVAELLCPLSELERYIHEKLTTKCDTVLASCNNVSTIDSLLLATKLTKAPLEGPWRIILAGLMQRESVYNRTLPILDISEPFEKYRKNAIKVADRTQSSDSSSTPVRYGPGMPSSQGLTHQQVLNAARFSAPLLEPVPTSRLARLSIDEEHEILAAAEGLMPYSATQPSAEPADIAHRVLEGFSPPLNALELFYISGHSKTAKDKRVWEAVEKMDYDERERLRVARRCYFCKKPIDAKQGGHLARDCPLAPK